jgi:putative ABC transport system permease protein
MARWEEQQKSYQFVKNELESHTSIETYSQGGSPIEPYPMPWNLQGDKNDYTTQNTLIVSPHHPSLLGLKLKEGRFFDTEMDKSRENKVVINEAAKKFWGIVDISQSRLLNKYWSRDIGYEILGVIKDFNYEHLSVRPRPLVMLYFEDVDANFLIKFKEGAIQSGLQFVQQLYSKINPGESFQYSFLSEEIAALYQKEKRLSQIYLMFTLIALLISATGLFTIALYDTHKRTKEIGIRKVNGARVSEILTMLNKDFIKLVAIAFVIAIPIVYYAMNKWLENFAYKTDLSWWIFALAGLLALGIALLTVSWKSWKAATRNPVEALRYE